MLKLINGGGWGWGYLYIIMTGLIGIPEAIYQSITSICIQHKLLMH